MSRLTGLWTSLKIVAAVADGSGTVDVSPDRLSIVVPDMHIDGAPLVHRPDSRLLPPHNMEIERDIRTVRFERARRYAAANDLNRITVNPPDAWIGIVSSGITHHEVREALRRLGLETDDQIAAMSDDELNALWSEPERYDPVLLAEAQRYEIELAVTSWDCGLADLYASYQIALDELQQQFIQSNLDELQGLVTQ